MNELRTKNSKKIYRFLKTSLDLFFAFFFILLGLPLLIVISILVKFSSRGSIFYLHRRIGKNKKYFYCIKFRTMHPEAEYMLENLLDKDVEIKKEYEKNRKIKNDPRITQIGKFLRKSSLDELPQLINVLKLEMSIIGPRPIVDDEVSKYGETITKVLSLKPGITGLWQVSGRNNLSYKRRVFLDNLYVEKYDFIMDLRIIIRTFGVLFFPMDRGAY